MSGRRESDDLQQKLIDALPDLVWVALPDGTIDACNRSWLPRFDVTPDTPGYDWLDLMHADDRDAWRTIWQNALISGIGFEIESRLKRRDGWRWYQIYVAPLADDQGRRLHWLFKAVDIHHNKELETNLRNSRNQAELLNQVGLDLVGELDLQRLTQRVTDAARGAR